MINSNVNHQKLPFSDPTHPPLWWRNTWMPPYSMFLFKIFDDGNPSSLSTLLQAKDADCTRARRDDCCKVLVFNSVGNVFYDLLSISGMPPPHLATNSHILSLVPIPKHSSSEQQAVLSSMTRAVFQDHKVPLGRCSQLELLSCHSLITTVVKQDCWVGNE